MRLILFLFVLCGFGTTLGQGNGFTFSYTGPTQIVVGSECMAPLNWGAPNTPVVSSNIPGGVIVSFMVYSISGGYHINDQIHGGTTVTVFYQAFDNFGNNALFGFSISFIDLVAPVFDPLSLPHNITVSCANNLPAPAMVEATDNCADEDPPLTISYAQTGNVPVCGGGIIKRTWVADDDLGNTARFVQMITVLADVTPPVITGNLQNGTAPCATAMAQYNTWLAAQRAAFAATDNGCGLMSKTDNAPPASQITSFCGVINVTFTAKDNCNNTSTVEKTFTVTNNVAPVITTPATGASGNCGQSNISQTFNNWIANHGGAVATDDCSSIFWTTFPPSPSVHDTCDAAINVMFIAGDGCGNFDTTSASFILTDDTGPTFSVQPTSSVLNCSSTQVDSLLMDWLSDAGHSVAHDLCTADNDLVVKYRINNVDLTLEQALQAWQDSLQSGCHDNVIINGVGLNNVKAYLDVRFIYADKCGNEAGAVGIFGITDNGKPVFTTMPADTTFTCSANQTWQEVFTGWYNAAGGATFSDACSEVHVNATMTADSAMNILNAALDTSCQQGAHVTIQFGLTDDCGNVSLIIAPATFNLSDTLPPVIVMHAADFISPCSANGGDNLQNWLDTLGGASATEGCSSVTWTFSWIDTSGMTNIGLPGTGPYPMLTSLDCSTGLDVIFTASDACQNTVTDTAVFSFIDTIAPVIVLINDTFHLQCQDTIPLNLPSVTDACTDSLLITFSDSTGIDSCFGQPNYLYRTWSAADACGNVSTAREVFIRLDTIAPTFTLPSDTVHFCSIDTLLLINVQDNCDPAPVTSWNDVITGLSCHQILSRTWAVTDACGNQTTAVQQFDLSDSTPPFITQSPGDFIYSCTASAEDLQVAYQSWRDSITISDGCSESDYFIALRDSYVLSDSSTWPGTPIPNAVALMCKQQYTLLADLVAFDVCGNAAVEQISFTVIDTTGPVFTNCQSVISILPDTSSCNALVTLVKPDADDVCFHDTIHITLQIDNGPATNADTIISLDTILDVGIHTALWTATDCKGNVGTCFTSIEIIDENAISLTCPGDTLLYTDENSCEVSLWVYPPLTAYGKCAKGIITLRVEVIGNATPDSVVFSSAQDSILIQFMSGINDVLLIARDSTGDIDTCIYHVELRDTILPSIVCKTDSIFLPPSGVEQIELATADLVVSASDNCGIQNLVFDPPFVTCDQNGQDVPVTVTVFDLSGNALTCVTSVHVETQPLMPQWSHGLCDDTLRLFANLPQGPDVNYTFAWTGPNSFSSSDENPVIADSDSTFSGTYFLSVQSDSGCISSGSVEVLIQTLLSPTLSISDDTICAGDDITLSTQPYVGNITYQWFQISPAGDTTISTSLVPSFDVTLNNAGTYSFFAVVVQDTCSSAPSSTLDVFVSAIPVVSIVESNTPLCIADTLFLLTQTIDTSLSYHWTGPNGFESFVPNPPGIPVSDLNQGDIFILTGSNGICLSLPDSLIVNLQPVPETPVISGDSVSCEGGTIILHANSGADNFEWLDPSGNTSLTNEDSLVVNTVGPEDEGEWLVIAYINGCPSDTSSGFHVRIDTTISIQITGPSSVCEGDSIHLAVTPSVSGIYAWAGPNNITSDLASPAFLAIEGEYSVTVMTNTGCAASDTFNVKVDQLPIINSLMSDVDGCVNGTLPIHLTADISPADTGNYIYHWNGPSGFTSSDTSLTFNNASSAVNGIYTLFIDNGACSSDTSSFELILNDSPSAPVVTGDHVYCYGDTIILNIDSPIPGGVYTWTSDDTTAVINSPGTLKISDAIQSFTGIYKVIVTIDGCTSAQSNYGVQVKASLAAPVINSATIACEGDSLLLSSNAPAGSTIQWMGPNGFSSTDPNPIIYPVIGLNAGAYTVSYILEDCPSPVSAEKNIIVQSALNTPGIQSDVTRICVDNPSPAAFCVVSGSGTSGATYTWLLNGSSVIGSAGPDSCITVTGAPLQGGLNEISVIASLQGCLSDTSTFATILGDEYPPLEAIAGPDMQFCPGEFIVLEANQPGASVGTWTSSSEDVVFSNIHNPNAELNLLGPGDYTLTWTLSFESCTNFAADSVNIGINFSPVVFPDTVNVPFGQTVEFIVVTNDSISMGPYLLNVVTNPQHGNALHAGNGIFRYTPNVGYVGTDFLTYRICSTDCPEECSEAIVVLKIGNEDDCIIPTLFTPNDDGVNDLLVIPCIEASRFPDNKIIVFNEWGAVVYTSSPYQNDWDGRVSGESLPVGTYFYIVDFGDGSEPRKTFLVLEK